MVDLSSRPPEPSRKRQKGFYFKTFRFNIGKICKEKLLENLNKVHNLTVILSAHPTSL